MTKGQTVEISSKYKKKKLELPKYFFLQFSHAKTNLLFLGKQCFGGTEFSNIFKNKLTNIIFGHFAERGPTGGPKRQIAPIFA